MKFLKSFVVLLAFMASGAQAGQVSDEEIMSSACYKKWHETYHYTVGAAFIECSDGMKAMEIFHEAKYNDGKLISDYLDDRFSDMKQKIDSLYGADLEYVYDTGYFSTGDVRRDRRLVYRGLSWTYKVGPQDSKRRSLIISYRVSLLDRTVKLKEFTKM